MRRSGRLPDRTERHERPLCPQSGQGADARRNERFRSLSATYRNRLTRLKARPLKSISRNPRSRNCGARCVLRGGAPLVRCSLPESFHSRLNCRIGSHSAARRDGTNVPGEKALGAPALDPAPALLWRRESDTKAPAVAGVQPTKIERPRPRWTVSLRCAVGAAPFKITARRRTAAYPALWRAPRPNCSSQINDNSLAPPETKNKYNLYLRASSQRRETLNRTPYTIP